MYIRHCRSDFSFFFTSFFLSFFLPSSLLPTVVTVTRASSSQGPWLISRSTNQPLSPHHKTEVADEALEKIVPIISPAVFVSLSTYLLEHDSSINAKPRSGRMWFIHLYHCAANLGFFSPFFYKFLGGLLNFLILPFFCCWERRKANIWLSALQGTAMFHVSGVCYNTAWDKYVFILRDGCIAWETRPLWEGDIYILLKDA